MPAQSPNKLDRKKTYIHINKVGIGYRKLFIDQQDYETFFGYLKEYLSAPPDPDKIKKTFTVNGRTFHGVPHQPKNYFDKLELIAYSLKPNHFHLIIYQKTKGSLEKLLRSLCTRYAIYYNKKYKRHGSLFQGSHKSIKIKSIPELSLLTRYIHLESSKEKDNIYSSYKEYLGTRITPWLKPKVVLSYFEEAENGYFKGINGYKNFVEKYTLNQEEKKLVDNITLESKQKQTKKSILAPEKHVKKEDHKKVHVHSDPISKPKPKTPHFIATSTMLFIILFSIGFRNVLSTSTIKTKTIATLPSPTPQVAGSETTEMISTLPSPTPLVNIEEDITREDTYKTETEINRVVIKISDGSASVNIRKKPTTKSEKVGKANDGDTFEFVSKDSRWYEIKLDNDTNAFISARYAQIEGEENK